MISEQTTRDMAEAWGDWAVGMADAFDTLMGTMVPETRPAKHRTSRRQRLRRPHDHGRCRECQPDSCHCECCVYDADLVLYARMGERRVVPIRISNERTREREVTLDLSGFTTSGGSAAPVEGTIVTPANFTLAACEHEDVILAVAIEGLPNQPKRGAQAARRPGDVDDCVVAYADLRIQGCDVRPVRIAVALLPRDCDRYDVHCACGCC